MKKLQLRKQSQLRLLLQKKALLKLHRDGMKIALKAKILMKIWHRKRKWLKMKAKSLLLKSRKKLFRLRKNKKKCLKEKRMLRRTKMRNNRQLTKVRQ